MSAATLGKWWTLDVARIRRASGKVEFPEQRPEFFFQRMQFWIAGHNRSRERPILRVLDQFGDARVVNDVKANLAKRLLPPLFLAQDMVVRLVLKAMRSEQFPDMLAQKLHAVPLVGIAPQPHPDQMNVIGHQAVGRAEQAFSCGSMKHDLSKLRVEKIVKPACAAQGHRPRPVNDRVALVILTRQAWQVKTTIRSLAEKTIAVIMFVRGLHDRENRAGSLRLLRFFIVASNRSIEREFDHSFR